MDSELLYNDQFNSALTDYYYLIEREYPVKEALKLVGDKYRLETNIRTLLYRGISSARTSASRSVRIINKPITPLIVDGYNVIFTLMNYRLGHFVFLSSDTICRDTGSLFGKISNEDIFSSCAELFLDFISGFNTLQTILYLDEPVSNSEHHYKVIVEISTRNNIDISINLVHSADKEILQHTHGTLATSDSVLLDRSALPILDIPYQILTTRYKTHIFNLKEKIRSLFT